MIKSQNIGLAQPLLLLVMPELSHSLEKDTALLTRYCLNEPFERGLSPKYLQVSLQPPDADFINGRGPVGGVLAVPKY